MHNEYLDARPVRVPVLVRPDLGSGWATLHELAELRGRSRPALQVLALLRWALWRAQQGDDTELTQEQLNQLLSPALESVA